MKGRSAGRRRRRVGDLPGQRAVASTTYDGRDRSSRSVGRTFDRGRRPERDSAIAAGNSGKLSAARERIVGTRSASRKLSDWRPRCGGCAFEFLSVSVPLIWIESHPRIAFQSRGRHGYCHRVHDRIALQELQRCRYDEGAVTGREF